MATKCALNDAAHPAALLLIKGKCIAQVSRSAVAMTGQSARAQVLTASTDHVLPVPDTR